jgi:hypothetical protein
LLFLGGGSRRETFYEKFHQTQTAGLSSEKLHESQSKERRTPEAAQINENEAFNAVLWVAFARGSFLKEKLSIKTRK